MMTSVCLTTLALAQAVKENPPEFEGVDIVEHLSDSIPLDLRFVGSSGDTVTLADYFEPGRPVIVIMSYYTCPMLCNLVFNGVAKSVGELARLPGRQFQIVSVSINPTETSEVADAKRLNYLNSIGKDGVGRGWDFLTGSESKWTI